MSSYIVDAVSKKFIHHGKEREILREVSALFKQGVSYGLSGISGSGKSTFLLLLSGFEKPSAGSICFDNQNIHNFKPHEHEEFLQKKIGILFQTPHLINELTVLENVMLKGLAAGLSKQEASYKALTLLQAVNLEKSALQKPSILSGGEQQRVALARALMNDPIFLLADEPTAHLDMQSRELILKLLNHYQKNHNMGLIVSSHDPYVIENMDYHYVLDQGKLSLYEKSHNNKKCC